MATPAQPPLHGTEKAVLDEFSGRRTRLNDTYNKITELSAEIAEHELVLKTLAPMDAKRKCFRLVNDVLVERSVGEVMPAVQKNRWGQDRGSLYGIHWQQTRMFMPHGRMAHARGQRHGHAWRRSLYAYGDSQCPAYSSGMGSVQISKYVRRTR